MPPWFSPIPYQRCFAPTYAAARAAWLEQAAACDWHQQQRCFGHSHTGPEAEALATDCLWYGNRDASKVLVIISATHGVEGFAGSAIQQCLLQGLNESGWQLQADSAVFFIHALTPWGFAWYRRCDENGIDLNRHFIDFDQPPPANSHHASVRDCLAIKDSTERHRALSALAEKLGRQQYEVALSGGQYEDSLAPFYGGREANHGRLVVETLFADFALADRDLIVLDLHTGLGPWGYGELICDHPPHSAGVKVAKALFGAAVAEPALGTSASVPKLGLMDYAWHQIMNSRSCYLTLEFGSYPTDALFDRLIEDHQFWAEYQPLGLSDPRWQDQRQRLLEHFCPADSDWRHGILFRAMQCVRRILAGFGNDV